MQEVDVLVLGLELGELQLPLEGIFNDGWLLRFRVFLPQVVVKGVKEPGDELHWVLLLSDFESFLAGYGDGLKQFVGADVAFEVLGVPYFLN